MNARGSSPASCACTTCPMVLASLPPANTVTIVLEVDVKGAWFVTKLPG
jgi:hypothetical protein